MGVLGLERIVWPADSTIAGADMDILARQHLWSVGLDFKHGTGHGVGSYMNVHEGPQGISRRNYTKLEVGMCVSNEPGYYEDGEFGFRIENVQMCQKHDDPKMAETFLKWENLTCAPYCRELLDVSLLNPDTRAYINNFHAQCLAKLTPFLSGEDADSKIALAYIIRQCAPIVDEAAAKEDNTFLYALGGLVVGAAAGFAAGMMAKGK